MTKLASNLRDYLKWYVLIALVVVCFLLWSYINHENRQGIMKFVVLDVGQGDSLFIESPTGKQVIIDGGPGRSLLREISKVMPWYDRRIDIMIVTNPDRDHYEGFIPLLEKYKTDLFVESGTKNDKGVYEFLHERLNDLDVPKLLARRGQKIDIGGGAYLEVFFPDRDVSGLSPNDGSIVMKLVYGETSVLLQGDSTRRIEEYIMTFASTTIKSTILKAGHHGSKTSSGEAYVLAVSPKWVVITAGENNSYGHPHKETLDTIKKFGIPALSTCINGTLYFESDGKNFVLKNKKIKNAVVGCKL